MHLAVIEITWNGDFWGNPDAKCYLDPQDLIDDISDYAHFFNVQKRMRGGWSSDYQKICERANSKVFYGVNHWKRPFYNFVGEYDSEDIHNVWKVECCERVGKKATYAFYVTSSNESDAIVVDFDDDGVMNEYSIRDKSGNEKQLEHSGWEWAVIKHLVDRLQLDWPNKNIAEGTMVYFVVAKDVWCYKKKH